MKVMRVIDFHNHFYPPEYVEAVREGPSNVKVTSDSSGNPLLHYPGDYNILVPGHRDIGFRAQVLDKAGVTTQVLSLTTPGVHVEAPRRSVELARLVNDRYAEIAEGSRGRFTALATLPLNEPSACADELERALVRLGLRGAMLFSNVNGTALSDRRYFPLYERANSLDAVFFIHPTSPVGVEAMTEYWLMPLIGFTMDTTLAAAKLVFSGVAARFPRIKWVLAHLGGAIPYIAERLDRGYRAFKECREHIDRPPSDYLKEFYFDTVNFDRGALRLAIEFAGAGHLVAGSDYPHQIGSLDKMVESVKGLDIPDSQKSAILSENAAHLLKL